MRAQFLQRLATALCGLIICLGATGCATYRYSIVQPANLAQSIGQKPVRLDYPPLVYQMAEREHRLVIQINNPTETPINLVGSQSYVVAPTGETHPLREAVIAPRSFIGLILPPAPRVYRAYPTFGFGLGFGYPYYGAGPYFNSAWGFYDDPFFYGPGPVDYYQVNPPNYWNWKTGPVRMMLVYQQGNSTNTFDQLFVFDRQKVEKK